MRIVSCALFEFTVFPANFPVSREFPLETGSRLTASSARQCGLQADFSEIARPADFSVGYAPTPQSLVRKALSRRFCLAVSLMVK